MQLNETQSMIEASRQKQLLIFYFYFFLAASRVQIQHMLIHDNEETLAGSMLERAGNKDHMGSQAMGGGEIDSGPSFQKTVKAQNRSQKLLGDGRIKC